MKVDKEAKEEIMCPHHRSIQTEIQNFRKLKSYWSRLRYGYCKTVIIEKSRQFRSGWFKSKPGKGYDKDSQATTQPIIEYRGLLDGKFQRARLHFVRLKIGL